MSLKTILQKLLVIGLVSGHWAGAPEVKTSKKIIFTDKKNYSERKVLLLMLRKDSEKFALKIYNGNLDDMRDLYDFDGAESCAFIVVDKNSRTPKSFIANDKGIRITNIQCSENFDTLGSKAQITGPNANERIIILTVQDGSQSKNIAVFLNSEIIQQSQARLLGRVAVNVVKGTVQAIRDTYNGSKAKEDAKSDAIDLTKQTYYVSTNYCDDYRYGKAPAFNKPAAFVLQNDTNLKIKLPYGELSIKASESTVTSVGYLDTVEFAAHQKQELLPTGITFAQISH